MTATLPDEVKAMLDAPNFWHLATINPDGSPHSTVMWVHRRGGQIMFNTAIGRIKVRNVAHDPLVLAVQDGIKDQAHRLSRLDAVNINF